MFTLPLIVLPLLALDVQVTHLDLSTEINPSAHTVRAVADFQATGEGPLVLRINRATDVRTVFADREEVLFAREPISGSLNDRLTINLTGDQSHVRVLYAGRFEQDANQGEQAGVIHNHTVTAHIGPNGVFLSEGSAWHPQPIGADGMRLLVPTDTSIAPVEGWSFVASGHARRERSESRLADPVHKWTMPRRVDGVALVGGRHVIHATLHDTTHGPVTVAAQFSEANAHLAPLFVDAACEYLDLYVPLLGPFPYERFTIVENFFSSGFAFPGFTLLGPRVVAMGERALGPGYLDHELVHNWWGNGVYVEPGEGNWCEALTSYCTNYYRRIADNGEDAGRDYRRGLVMKASRDPAGNDNRPVGEFGLDPEVSKFVGYDKGAFVFMMLEHGPGMPGFETDRSHLFKALRTFAEENMGQYASWDDIRAAVENTYGESREAFFRFWVDEHHTPMSPTTRAELGAFRSNYTGDEILDFRPGRDEGGRYLEIDPDFLTYRLLPPDQVVPTLGGTMGPDGVKVVTDETRSEVASYMDRIPRSHPEEGENLILIGKEAIEEHSELIERAVNPLDLDAEELGSADAVLHTMPHPDRPGRFITVFHAFNDAGWSKLRLISFYTRDTTIIWGEGGQVTHRETFEPPRHVHIDE